MFYHVMSSNVCLSIVGEVTNECILQLTQNYLITTSGSYF